MDDEWSDMESPFMESNYFTHIAICNFGCALRFSESIKMILGIGGLSAATDDALRRSPYLVFTRKVESMLANGRVCQRTAIQHSGNQVQVGIVAEQPNFPGLKAVDLARESTDSIWKSSGPHVMTMDLGD